MTDYSNQGYNYHSQIVTVDDTDYLVQGGVKDPLTMFRPINEVLECEKDAVQTLPRFDNTLEGDNDE